MAKLKIRQIATAAEFFESVDDCAVKQARVERLEAELKSKIVALQVKYSADIDPLKKDVEKLLNECSDYASLHHTELFGKNKSAATTVADYGFRTGTPKLVKLVKSKEEDVALSLENEDGGAYVSKKLSLDKEAIKSALERGVESLKRLFRVDQDEAFFINPKADDTRKA